MYQDGDCTADGDVRQSVIVHIAFPVDITAEQCERAVRAQLPDVAVEILGSGTPGDGYLLLTPGAGSDSRVAHAAAEQMVAAPHHCGLIEATHTWQPD